MADPKVINVVLNTNRRADTLACLDSLQQSSYQNCVTIVLDCASTDGSIDAIHQGFPDVQIIPLVDNRGYSGNNNVGIETAMSQGADWIFLINEDTILAPDCLAHLVEVGESDDQIGIIGPMVYHHNEPQIIQSAGGVLGAAWTSIHLGQDTEDKGQFSDPRLVSWISGCAMMVRREVVETVGVLDERFFYYWDETEWCLRAGNAGWKVMHVPSAKIWHKGVQRDNRPKPTVTYYSTRNHLLMLNKHHAPIWVWLLTWLQLIRTLASWTFRSKWRYKRDHRNAMWKGIVDYLGKHWGGPIQL